MPGTFSDEELIASAVKGNAAGYAGLINRHRSYAFTLALRVVKNREDAQEVAQDSFLKAFRALPEFRMDSKFTTWFYRIVYTTALNHRRKQGPELDQLTGELAERIPDSGFDSSFLIDRRIKKQYIDLAMEALPVGDALVLQLFYFQEHSLEECGTIMGLEANTIKIRLHRARQRLKTGLQHIMQFETADL